MTDDAPPKQLQTIAAIQLVSGLVNILFMAALVTISLTAAGATAGTCVGVVFAVLGCPLGCVGVLGWGCGLWGLALLPIGLFEVVAGGMGLVNSDTSSPTLIRAAAIVEMASLLFGGLGSAVAGVAVWSLLKDPDVVGYLDGAP